MALLRAFWRNSEVTAVTDATAPDHHLDLSSPLIRPDDFHPTRMDVRHKRVARRRSDATGRTGGSRYLVPVHVLCTWNIMNWHAYAFNPFNRQSSYKPRLDPSRSISSRHSEVKKLSPPYSVRKNFDFRSSSA